MTQVWTVRCDGLGGLKGGCLGWAIAAVAVASTLLDGVAIAQIAPDGTLGRESSVVTPRSNLRGAPGILIQGGAVRGSNLFQSFAEFNVGAGQRVYFANPAGIANILSRVTGANPSNILGTLGVAGAANLFLLNPNGIVFGPKARLDVAGSFVASTATSLSFGNGSTFSATDPEPPPLLAVNLTPGLQYGTDYRGAITNAGNLAVGAGQTLTLAGSTVSSTGALSAPGGLVQVLGDRVSLLDNARIDVSSRNGGGTVLIGGDFQGKGQVPNASQTIVAPGVTIAADALQTGNGGKVVVWANNTTRFDGTISARGGATSGNGGAVEVSGKQTLAFNGHVDTTALNGRLGSLLLDPFNLDINQPFTSASDTTFQADNDITFNAPVTITTVGAGVTALAGNNIAVNSDISTLGGAVTLTAQGGNVSINGATIATGLNTDNSNGFTGVAGDIELRAGQQVVSHGGALLGRSNSASNQGADYTAIKISGNAVQLDATTISTTNLDAGLAGDVAISAQNEVTITNSKGPTLVEDGVIFPQPPGIFSQGNTGRILIGESIYFTVSPTVVQIDASQLVTNNLSIDPTTPINAGGISIKASQAVILSNGAELTSSTNRPGNAGTILIATPGSVTLSDGSSIATDAYAKAQGNAGGVGIRAGSLSMTGESAISTSTYAQNSTADSLSAFPDTVAGSYAGAVVLLIDDDATLVNSNIFNNLEHGASGSAGLILLAANSLSLLDGAQIQTLVRGIDTQKNRPAAKGTAGNIFIGVDQTIKLIGRNDEGFSSAIFSSVQTGASGTGGNVFLVGNNNDRARSVQLRDGGLISVNNLGTAPTDTAGNVSVAARGIWLDNKARILAVSQSGRGGNILLNTDALILGRNSVISTSTFGSSTSSTIGNGTPFQTGAGNIAIGRGKPFDSLTPNGSLAPRYPDRTLLVAGKTIRNNDIAAFGLVASGGFIQINAFRLQDIAKRSLAPTTNDISAESAFGNPGEVVINTLNVFPSLKANPLPARYDVPRVAEGCDPRTRQESSRFIITGRGGVPIDPSDVLNPETIVDSPSPTPTSSLPPSQPSTSKTEVEAIVPARGFRQNADGTVQLTAYVTDPAVSVLPDPLLPSASTCYAP